MARISASERAATRQRLIEAGKSEFAERGLAGARFDEISLAAGSAKGTIYNYFADKETLFVTIVEEWCRQLVAGFVLDPDRPACDDLLEIARLDVQFARKDPDLARVVINHVPGLAAGQRRGLGAALEPALELLTSTIAAGQLDRSLASDFSARTLAQLFLSMLSAIEQEALDPTSDLQLDDVVPLVDRTVIAGMRSTPRQR